MLERHHEYNSCTNELVNSGKLSWLVGHLQHASDLGAPNEFPPSLAILLRLRLGYTHYFSQVNLAL